MRWFTHGLVLASSLFLGAGLAQAADCGPDLKQTDDYRTLSAKLKCLETRIRLLEGSRTPASTTIGAAAAAPAPVQSLPQSQEVDGVRIELDRCERKEGISCKIFVTSLREDINVGFERGSIAVDSNGMQYFWHGYQGLGEASISTGVTFRSFISGVRTAAQISFTGMPEQSIKALTVMKLQLIAKGDNSITFRNVALK
jgi:hypothetical protein